MRLHRIVHCTHMQLSGEVVTQSQGAPRSCSSNFEWLRTLNATLAAQNLKPGGDGGENVRSTCLSRLDNTGLNIGVPSYKTAGSWAYEGNAVIFDMAAIRLERYSYFRAAAAIVSSDRTQLDLIGAQAATGWARRSVKLSILLKSIQQNPSALRQARIHSFRPKET
ncbi:uncharacterized protein LOC111263796 [Varroa jacobsoni]|uniref:uncharacterized protein LOC111263796 n=1 Tax=Varroa jacobsoni TaxID=62625 RepID=UPI000BF6D39A|nr:uncharacterized protein LOC111263796 [Varroa jacobsoni]